MAVDFKKSSMSSRFHLVSDGLHHGRCLPQPGWHQSRLGGSGREEQLCDSHLLPVLPPVQLQALQHHDDKEHRRRPELEHAEEPLQRDRRQEFCSGSRLWHPSEGGDVAQRRSHVVARSKRCHFLNVVSKL